ncbi:hypothetical protein [Marixanthomonas spongiae]|uniref:Uncharacterized protein n=1 Tax=Marixanthomonas spongiae TaxID=2174845 RepID=A0A2U0I580_9FLAO|nr:hypothetical protein [Marixanthomonas spongiae]PVW16263.1 hypothetical protein DDV96_03060 [Marixanthomonas spongiae]
MKPLKTMFLISFLCFGILKCFAQPYTLDKEIEPIKLQLQKDTRKGHEGGKFLATLGSVDATKYYYVKGHDMFQFVDVLVKALSNQQPLEVTLVNDNWKDVVELQSTQTAKDGIVHFKIRAYSSFGLKINSPSREKINYSIIVQASKPHKTYLGSPFTKIKESNMKAGAEMDTPIASSGNSNIWLYIILGIAILVIGVLAGKLMGRKAAIVIGLISIPLQGLAQDTATPGFFHQDQYFNGEDLENGTFESALKKGLGDGYDPSDDIEDLNSKLKSIKDFLDNAVNLYKSYTGLGACINSTPPPGEPRIPSFCALPTTDAGFEDDSNCAGCFLNAREQFNNVRYLFEQLSTIYKCTKTFSNAALSFGDNASGIHGVSGMAWQAERRKIEKSITELEQAYDKKYAELLQSLSDAMLKLSECEAQYGVEDWFDRFGYMYFEFIQDKYKRKD